MDTFTPKSKAGSLGRSLILFCGGQGFISPIRGLPRFVEQNNLSTECVMNYGKITGCLKKHIIKWAIPYNQSYCITPVHFLKIHICTLDEGYFTEERYRMKMHCSKWKTILLFKFLGIDTRPLFVHFGPPLHVLATSHSCCERRVKQVELDFH